MPPRQLLMFKKEMLCVAHGEGFEDMLNNSSLWVTGHDATADREKNARSRKRGRKTRRIFEMLVSLAFQPASLPSRLGSVHQPVATGVLSCQVRRPADATPFFPSRGPGDRLATNNMVKATQSDNSTTCSKADEVADDRPCN